MAFSAFEMIRESAWMHWGLYALIGTIALPVVCLAVGMIVLPFLDGSKTNYLERCYKLFCRLWTMAGMAWAFLVILVLLGVLWEIVFPMLDAAGRPDFSKVAENAVGELFGCGMLSVFFGLWVIFWTHSIGEMNKSEKLKTFGSRIMFGCVCATGLSVVVLISMAILRSTVASLVSGILLGVCSAKCASASRKAEESSKKDGNPLREDDQSSARFSGRIAVFCGVLAFVFMVRAIVVH